MTSPSGLRVRCNDAGVQAGLTHWLEELRISAPTDGPEGALTLDVAVGDVPALNASDPVFEQPEVRFFRGSDGRGIRLSWGVAPATAEVPAGSRTAAVLLSQAAARRLEHCTRSFLMAVVIVLLRRVGWYHLHAATAIDPGGRGWLIAGNAHAGKSTTAALLAASGWRVGTDDAAFLERGDARIVVHTCRARIALREGGRRLLARAGGVGLPARRKVGFWPEDLGGSWTPLVEPEIIIFTSLASPRTRTLAEPMGRVAAAAELVRWSAWVLLEPDVAQAHLDVLTSLTHQARCYRVALGRDLFSQPNRLIELVQ